MKLGVLVVVLLAVTCLPPALSACGSESDPYIGTWHDTAGGSLVIRLESHEYRAYYVNSQEPDWVVSLELTKRDGELRALGQGDRCGDVVIRLEEQDDRLQVIDCGWPPREFAKVSFETAVPSPGQSTTALPETSD